ncbi:aromatic amino acid ammonia-lyase [Nonomuraea gerenzanensis]|uniref:Histidine ammonia-lyase n=1 Tax=Nonomuraea gerenzanensis TaxID=93944 RepID=A0A1M4END6_9ACTN|nr:aromatic amino acid ammonia-lyase [Nonomuraea gerenzanensis]UBU11830.1 aromatic amino acid ammonia-lyase [Nonomuraea gerenzanensis]SBP00335.1 Histidine ammonia-lyase [Nonomuraea gerenzanensis]
MELDGAGLTCAQVHEVAYGGARVAIASLDRARAAWATAQELTGPVYGRSTGVGANRDIVVEGAGLDLLRSHAVSAGPPLPPARARAMLAVRLNQLLAGGSGVDPAVCLALAQAINDGYTPPLHTYGAIGTGDLTALATTALCLLGELPWHHTPPAPEPPATAPISAGPRHPLTSGDALPFISSGAATLADAAIACHRLRHLLDAAVDVAMMSFTAVDASAEPLAAVVQEARPQPGQAAVAARLRGLLAHEPTPRIQDPYGFRAFPQVHGAALDALGRAVTTIETDLNAATENPLFAASLAWHNGNFHSAPVALALDALRAALVQTAQLSTARLATLMDPAYTGRLPFLADRPGASGALILEYVAQDALADLRHLANPATTGTAVISRGVEDHAGFATQAARHTLRCLEPLEIVLACERTAAVRALHTPAPDRPLTADLEASRTALSPG